MCDSQQAKRYLFADRFVVEYKCLWSRTLMEVELRPVGTEFVLIRT